MGEGTSTLAEQDGLVSLSVLALLLPESGGLGDGLGDWTLDGTKTRLPHFMTSVRTGGALGDGALDGTKTRLPCLVKSV